MLGTYAILSVYETLPPTLVSTVSSAATLALVPLIVLLFKFMMVPSSHFK